MLANAMQSDFSWHYICERHEIRKKKCLWQNPHVFPWTEPSERALDFEGHARLKLLDLEILNDFMFCVACEYRHCYLNIGVAWALHSGACKISHNWVYVFSLNADEEVTQKKMFEVACSFKLDSVAQCRLQPWRHLSLLSKLFPRAPATRSPNLMPPICYDFKCTRAIIKSLKWKLNSLHWKPIRIAGSV